MPEGFESHIYYEIGEPYRGKGYAKEALAILLDTARAHRLHEVILTVAEDNLPSKGVAIAHNAVLLESKPDALGKIYGKYRIVL